LPPKLTVCEPLVHALRSATKTRFPEMNGSIKDAHLAAVVNPRFKLDWLDDQADKFRMIALLKERVAALHALEQQIAANARASTSAYSESGSGSATTASVSTTTNDEDFFSLLTAKRQAQQTETQSPNDHRQEVDKFVRDGASGLDSLKEYPYIKKLYVTLNTGLPSSASVERLFSLGGRIFTPLRSRMTSDHFEMMMFLRMAHHFYSRGVGRWN
jgi:hypothetical protein